MNQSLILSDSEHGGGVLDPPGTKMESVMIFRAYGSQLSDRYSDNYFHRCLHNELATFSTSEYRSKSWELERKLT